MFLKARLKLTAWYLLIIMSVSIMFSGVIYEALTNEFERFERAQRFRIERRLQEGGLPQADMRFRLFSAPILTNSELIEETKQRIFIMLVVINSGVLFIAGGLGYFLAGRTLKPIKEMVDEQNRFISDASHELRTPLTSLKSAFEVFLREENQTLKEANTLIKESIDEVNKMQSLSESMLQLAQYQVVNGQFHFEKLAIKKVINEAARKIKPLAEKKEVKIIQDIEDLEIEGNKYSLIDLIVILLDNAIKYSFSKNKVIVQAKKTDGLLHISIKDKGIGISKKDLEKIFDRFYRADNVRTKSGSGGYGLGLSIAKKIVDFHRGSMNVESKPGKGSIFTVNLPMYQLRKN